MKQLSRSSKETAKEVQRARDVAGKAIRYLATMFQACDSDSEELVLLRSVATCASAIAVVSVYVGCE